jgi:hypothetical protein
VDSIKLNISGDDHPRSGAVPRTVMSEEEIRAGVTVARDFQRMVNAHCRAAESVKRAVRTPSCSATSLLPNGTLSGVAVHRASAAPRKAAVT